MDEALSDVHISQFLSECLRIFRKKLMLIAKDITRNKPQVQREEQIESMLKEGLLLLTEFSKYEPDFTACQSMIARFISRVKEIVESIQLKLASKQLSQYLIQFNQSLKENISFHKMVQILEFMLLNVPKSYLDCNPNRERVHQQFYKTFSGQKTQKSEDSRRNLNTESMIALEREFQIMKYLNIQEAEFRKLFFLSRQDLHRKDNSLYEDMLMRNQHTQQFLTQYQRTYQKYIQKKELRKNKINSIPQNEEVTTLTAKPQKIPQKLKKQKIQFTPNKITIQNSRIKTEQNPRTKNVSISEFHSLKLKNPKPKEKIFHENVDEDFLERRKKLKTSFLVTNQISNQCVLSSKMIEVEKYRLPKAMGNIIELKKINFLGSRIELMPESSQQVADRKTDKKKAMYNRAQEHFKKKISILTQPKGIQSSYSYSSPTKQKANNPLNIYFTPSHQ